MADLIDRQAAIEALAMADAKKGWKSLKFSEMQKCLLGLPSAQPDKTYEQGWEDGREALRKEMWEDGRDRLN